MNELDCRIKVFTEKEKKEMTKALNKKYGEQWFKFYKATSKWLPGWEGAKDN